MYLKSAWRALGKIYYHLQLIGNAQEFKLSEEEIGDEEAEFRARQLLKVTSQLKEATQLYEYLSLTVIQSAKLTKLENGCYGIRDSDTCYQQGDLVEYLDLINSKYELSTVDYYRKVYYIVGYPLPIEGTTVRIRGYIDDVQV